MKVGSIVRNDYQGITRWGKITEVEKSKDGWTYYKVAWVDDEVYEGSVRYRTEMTGKSYEKELYRGDELKEVDVVKTIDTLQKLMGPTKECFFVRAQGKVWVPRPSSWIGGWSRSLWLKKYFGDTQIVIASPDVWSQLVQENGYSILQEKNNNFFEIN